MNPTEKPTFQDNAEMSLYNNYGHMIYSPAATPSSDNFYFYGMPVAYSNQLAEPQYYSMAPEPVDKEASIASPSSIAFSNSTSPTTVSSPQSLANSFNFQNISSLVYSQQQSTPQPVEPAKKYEYSFPTPTESNTSSCSSETTQDWSKSESLNNSTEGLVGRKRPVRRSRTQYSKSQVDALEATFQKAHYPSLQAVDVLSDKLGLSVERIAVWFQNRRAKYKKTKKPTPQTQIDSNLVVKQFYQQQQQMASQLSAPSNLPNTSPLTINRTNPLYPSVGTSRLDKQLEQAYTSQPGPIADTASYASKFAPIYPASHFSNPSVIPNKSNYAPVTLPTSAYASTAWLTSSHDYNPSSATSSN